MPEPVLQLDLRDNVLVALVEFTAGATVKNGGATFTTVENIPAKHKLALTDLAPGDAVWMYGMVVGEVTAQIQRGGLLSVSNVRHRAEAYSATRQPVANALPSSTNWAVRTFMGYHRADGQIGTRNYWIVLPLVFCENRNVRRLQEAFEDELGYGGEHNAYRQRVRSLAGRYAPSPHLVAKGVEGADLEIQEARGPAWTSATQLPNKHRNHERIFPNIDGIRFLTHEGGCGGTRQDAQALCGLLSGYIHHPNVAGATVLSLGCQNAQVSMLMSELRVRDPELRKPVLVFDQQSSGRESTLMMRALERTFEGLVEASRATRAPAPLSGLTIALQCGASDGFSGISANPTLGYVSDLIGRLGGRTILSEFPELHGVEQELINRCESDELAQRFSYLMQTYAARAKSAHSGFDFNPSPGNIRDGLITGAMKSAGAARKGGVAAIRGVLDYPEYVIAPGLNLQCTPGNDVESVTAQVGAGANLVLFTTGLGTPTGNPIAPVIKVSSNSLLAERMSDIIDFDAGGIIAGETSVNASAEDLLELCIDVASGDRLTKTEGLGQNDFIPWKRGISL